MSPVWDCFKFNVESECMLNSGNRICGVGVELELELQHIDAAGKDLILICASS